MIDIEDIDHILHLEIDTGVDPDTDQGQEGHIPPVDTSLIHHITINPILHIIQEDLTPDILSLLDIINVFLQESQHLHIPENYVQWKWFTRWSLSFNV